MIEVQAFDNRIEVPATVALKSMLYDIGNGKWSAHGSKFLFPKTPITAEKIESLLSRHKFDFKYNAEFEFLLRQGDTIREAQKWKREHSLEQPTFRTIATDPTYYQHQLDAYAFGKDLRSVMFWMGVGTGKSKLAIELARNNEHKRIVLVCPPYIHRDDETWEKQFRLWFQGDYKFLRLLKGTAKKKADEARKFLRQGSGAKIIGINYESFWREGLDEFFMQEKFDLLIADEFHKCKSHNSSVAEFTAKSSRNFKQIIGLTGTVMYSNPLDVYGQYRVLDSGIFGTSFTRFRSRYADIYDHNGIPIIKGFINQEELIEKIEPITFQVDESVLNLPDPIHDVRSVELSGEEKKVYQQMEQEAALDLGATQGYSISTNILTKMMRLRQITGGSVPLQDWDTDETRVHRLGDSKKQLLKQILEDLPKGEHFVVFARFIMDLQMVREAAEELKLSYGEISGRAFDKNRWNNGEVQILGVNDSAGEGMDFTRANYGCFFSYDYSVGKFKQCVGRIRRPPNTRFAYFYHLVAKGTIDEVMYKGIQNNQDMLQGAIDYLRSLSTKK